MAGVKGRSGGPRPNSGGKRPGAGRPRKPPVPIDAVYVEPKRSIDTSLKGDSASKVKAPPTPRIAVIPQHPPTTGPVNAAIPPAVNPASTPIVPAMTAEEANACRNDPLEFLRFVWAGRLDASPTQIRAAAAALPFLHKKLGEGGKKDQTQKAAEKVASRFAPVAAPRLISSNGK
jgi:phage terminase small subunit